MRVLWFANAPTSESSEYLFKTKLNNAGWIDSLHQRLSAMPGVEMGFAYRWNVRKLIAQKVNHTSYYVVPNELSLPEKIKNNLFSRVNSKRRLKDYLNIINEFKPDVIHIFGTENEFGLIQEHTDCPCVVQMQGVINYIIQYYFHAFSTFTVFTNSKLIRLITGSSYYHNYIKLKKQATRESVIFSLTKNVCGFTAFDKRIAFTLGNNLNYYHIPVMLRPSFYQYKWENPEKKPFRIISTMNPNTYKGLETIYRTSYQLNKKYPGEFEFVVAGIADKTDINIFTKKTLGREIIENSCLIFKGNMNEEFLIRELLNSHVMMHPSLCDTSPNSVNEAMILGMPVVSTNVGGIPSMIDDEINGYLVQNMDYLSFAYIINHLRENPQLAAEVGLKARETAMARHNEEKIASDTINMYKEISKTGN